MTIDQDALQEPGRYFAGMGLVAAGPQRHSVMVLPPSAAPFTAVPLIYGFKSMAFAVLLVDPRSEPSLPITLITPLLSDVPLCTFFVLEMAQPEMALAALLLGEVCNASVIAVRHDEAAKITSETLARTV